MLSNALKSLLAGIFIGIGSLIYSSQQNALGAILFSVGLLSVFWLGLNLYTGKLPYVDTAKDWVNLFVTLLFNLIGGMFLFAYPQRACDIVTNKLNLPLITVFVSSIVCGALIYLAVKCHKEKNDWATLILVPAFILSGSEHSIADACYIIMSRTFTVDAFIFLLIVVVGNFVGGKGLKEIYKII